MAFRLTIGDGVVRKGGSVIDRYLPCYDTLNDAIFYVEWDDLLLYRSALEFVREQLSDAQRGELDTVDAHWRSQPDAFNSAFAAKHATHAASDAMRAWVQDENGDTPIIPRSHWWWRAITEAEA
jgi:hypothetical protein